MKEGVRIGPIHGNDAVVPEGTVTMEGSGDMEEDIQV